jgi:DNA-binding MarR family transcriptional regulator
VNRQLKHHWDAIAVWRELDSGADAATTAVTAALRKHRLTPAQYRLLGVLEDIRCGCCGEGECRCESSYLCQNDVSETIACTKGNVSGLLSRLAAEGLISREENPRDRREKAVRITARGRLRYLAAMPDVEAAVTRAFRPLSPLELFTLSGLLRQIAHRGDGKQ